jgi:hypothetical protein
MFVSDFEKRKKNRTVHFCGDEDSVARQASARSLEPAKINKILLLFTRSFGFALGELSARWAIYPRSATISHFDSLQIDALLCRLLHRST